RAAWRRVRRNQGAAGGDGVALAAFERDLDRQLDGLRAAVLDGTYRPGPLRRVAIAKPDGGARVLAIPCVGDRVLQTAMAAALEKRLEPRFHDASFGYRPGRSVAAAVACVRRHIRAGRHWAVDADIRSFFDSIDHRLLRGDLRQAAGDPSVERLAAAWLAGFSPQRRGIAQGSPLSPLLANLFLDPVDRELDAEGVAFVRYADDLVLLSPNRRAAEAALRRFARALGRRRLTLNQDKTSLAAPGNFLHFLGERIHLK
ncbi:MAG TPA: reverse transcriptase domain-containing protein, partial [Azospirillaceae bacterium]|nr:reverse transcriptase domain-containing protein [Azospirillaceae bacterium]